MSGSQTSGSIADLLHRTRRQLLESARRLGLTGIHRLPKAEIAERIHREAQRLAGPAGAPDAARKFDLGSAPVDLTGAMPDIPWGYGQDRITAMAIDPERLYVYWEVTDEAIDRARSGLGAAGADAWLALRIYDVTQRIFDGTNAHHYFDHAIARTDRQWFFFIDRPSSTIVAEVGLQSAEGSFVRIARSGRADFPRRAPAPAGPVHWLTVRSASGPAGDVSVDGREPPARAPDSGATGPPGPAPHIRPTDGGGRDGEWIVRGETVQVTWDEAGEWVRSEGARWEGPVVRVTWEAGPFVYPVAAPAYVEERYEGAAAIRAVDGRSHVVYGPWRVVIRGLGARAERRVVAVWEIHRSWIASAGSAARATSGPALEPGASEHLARGASEVAWIAGSERRLGGASEMNLLGASELGYRGASEAFAAGASEWRARGASERRFLGASEVVFGGASESRYAGGSERLYPGASERAWSGASEHRAPYPADSSG